MTTLTAPRSQVRESTDSAPPSWKLSPSDFAFLWEECKRCYYLKITRDFKRPSAPMPSIFTKIAGMEKRYFDFKHTRDVHPDIPPGVVAYGEKFIKSVPISFPEFSSSCFISGRFDNVVRFDDDSYGVIDFKTSEAKDDNLYKYGRQLHAYTYALEHPAPGALTLSPVSRLGLLCLEPHTLNPADGGQFTLSCRPTWMEVQRDDAAFMDFIREVLATLDSPEPPPASERCIYCRYRDAARSTGH